MALVSSISWLENNLFLVSYTTTSFDADTIPPTVFHLVTRQLSQPPSCAYQKLPDPCLPYGLNRSPPYHFIQRLKDFPPNLQDLIVVASTASTDVGLITRSKAPLTSGLPAEKVTGVFTTTIMAIDSRRAQLPMTEELDDTSPIGVVVDLSSKVKVPWPLPGEETEESSTPLPAIMILNNDGILSLWWIVYADSIRQGTIYPGLVVAGNDQSEAQSTAGQQASPLGATTSQAAPTSSPSSFALPNPFGKAPTPAFGTSGTFGPASGAFGASSALGKAQSPWATSSPANNASGGTASAFGNPSTLGGTSGSAFGATGVIGNRASPWGAPSSGSSAASESAFGKPGGLGMGAPVANPFGIKAQSGNSASSPTGGFVSFANASGFMGALAQSGRESALTKPSTGASFGSNMETDSSFGGTPKERDGAPSTFLSTTGFSLGSTFKGDGTAANDKPKTANDASSSFFSDHFSNTLGEAQNAGSAPVTKEAEMEDSADEDDKSSQVSSLEPGSFTPATQPKSPLLKTTPPLSGRLVGSQSQTKDTPAAVQSSTPAAPSLIELAPTGKKPQDTPTTPPVSGGWFGTQSQTKDTPAAVQSSTPATSSWIKPSSTAMVQQDAPPETSQWRKPTPVSTTPNETPTKPAEMPENSMETTSSPTIKSEPQEDRSPKIDRQIPEPALPPESTSKASFAAGESSNSSASTSKAGADDAPLPPDFLPLKSKAKANEVPSHQEPSLPPEDEDGGFNEGLDDEGSGVDVAQELSPTTAESSFGGSFGKSSVEKSPLGGMFTKVKPQQPRQEVKSLFGEVGQTSVPHFPPPKTVPESPRSPSPVRPFLQGDVLRAANSRSVSAPGHPAEGLNQKKSVPRKTVATSRLRVPPEAAAEGYRRSQNRLSDERARRIAEEEQNLSDREDEKVREELETEIEGTKTLDDFLAHQDYVGTIDRPGVPGQIEKVYRDINSMIDTLGLNARTLGAFVKGHTEMYKQGGRSIKDLEDNDDWCLIEIGDLESIEGSLSDRLEEGRIHDLQDLLSACRELRKEIKKFEAKGREVSKFLEAKSDPEHNETVRFASLNQEQATLQHDLRKEFTSIQKLFAEAEGGITMLKIALATQDNRNGKAGAVKKPTVEAVTNTIMKMTRMAEKKSGDIDVLETQLKRLRFSSPNDVSLADSLSAMKISHSPSEMKKGAVSRRSLMRTPEKLNTSLRDSIRAGHDGATPKRGMADVTVEEVQRYRDKVRQRDVVNKTLKEAFLAGGLVVRGLE